VTGPGDDRAVRYLLGDLSVPDRDAFEDEYFVDEDIYGELLAAEDDLIDRYCAGGLPPEQRERFEQRYLATPEGRERVAFARALKSYAGAHRGSAPAAHARPGRWLAWAAVLVAAFSVAALLRQHASAARTEAALQEQLTRQRREARDQERRTADLSQQVARLQEQARAAEELLGGAAAGALRAVTLALAGTLQRDGGTPARLALPSGVSVVRLQLRLAGDLRAAYRASLQTPEGRELWTRGDLKPARDGSAATVTFAVPAAVLAPGQYVVTLTDAARPRGDSEADFVFEVRRP
jgi:hypothetical protein